MLALLAKKTRKKETYNSRDSLVTTHPTTMIRPISMSLAFFVCNFVRSGVKTFGSDFQVTVVDYSMHGIALFHQSLVNS